jgi:hypothetical protein
MRDQPVIAWPDESLHRDDSCILPLSLVQPATPPSHGVSYQGSNGDDPTDASRIQDLVKVEVHCVYLGVIRCPQSWPIIVIDREDRSS